MRPPDGNSKRGAKVFLYSNQPVIRVGDGHYTQMRNFIDFLAVLTNTRPEFELFVPCREWTEMPQARWSKIALPDRTHEVGYYGSYRYAIFRSFWNAISVARRVRAERRLGNRVVIAGPGPNSFLFWLSYMVPGDVPFAYFIRGDTEKTVKHAYEGSWLQPLMTGLVGLFRSRINALQKEGRALVMVFGEQLAAKYGGIGERVKSIAPLFDLSEWIAQGGCKRDESAYRILYVGRLSKEKNLPGLIRACHMAAKEGAPFSLSLVGEGEEKGALMQLVEDLGLQEQVTFHGHIRHGDQLKQMYDSHDLFCLASFTEGVPRVIVEALARGLPVLATRAGSIETTFAGQVRMLDGHAPEMIYEGIAWCRDHPAEMAELGMCGRGRIMDFDLSENARRVAVEIEGFANDRKRYSMHDMQADPQ